MTCWIFIVFVLRVEVFMAGLQTCSGQLSGTLRRHPVRDFAERLAGTPMAGCFWAGQSSPKMDDLWGAHGCPYFRKASLILGPSVFFWVCVQPFCRKPWKLDCNILQQRVSHSDCNDRSFIPVPELFGSWLQAVGRVKKTPRLRANAVTRSCRCKSYLMPPRGPKRVVAAQRNLLQSLDSLWMS